MEVYSGKVDNKGDVITSFLPGNTKKIKSCAAVWAKGQRGRGDNITISAF